VVIISFVVAHYLHQLICDNPDQQSMKAKFSTDVSETFFLWDFLEGAS